MADYSKQYCEICDPGFPWDFDLEEEFLNLYNGDQVPIICEGLGIIGIAVDERGRRFVLESQALGWIEYEHFLQEFKTKHKNNVN